jgi:hypothetical protein
MRRTFGSRKILLVIGSVLLIIFPSLVTGTSFVNGSGTSTLTGTAASITFADCGFYYVSAGSYDSTYISSLAGTMDTGNHLYTTMTANINILANSGSAGYEYLEGELYFGCYNVPSTGTYTATLTITPSSFTPSANWYAVFVTPDTGTTASTYESAQGNWCNPTTSAQGGTACSGSAVACGAYTPNLYLPVNTQIALKQGSSSGNEWVYINGAYVTNAATCGKDAVGPSGIAISSTTSAMEYIEDIGFGFGNTASISGTITLSYAISAH